MSSVFGIPRSLPIDLKIKNTQNKNIAHFRQITQKCGSSSGKSKKSDFPIKVVLGHTEETFSNSVTN